MATLHVEMIFRAMLSKKEMTGREGFLTVLKNLSNMGIGVNTNGDGFDQQLSEKWVWMLGREEITDFIEWYSTINKGTQYKGKYYDVILDQGRADLNQAGLIWTKINEMLNKALVPPLKTKCEKYIKDLEDKMKLNQYPHLVARVRELEMSVPELQKENHELKAQLEQLAKTKEQENGELKARLEQLAKEKASLQSSVDILASISALQNNKVDFCSNEVPDEVKEVRTPGCYEEFYENKTLKYQVPDNVYELIKTYYSNGNKHMLRKNARENLWNLYVYDDTGVLKFEVRIRHCTGKCKSYNYPDEQRINLTTRNLNTLVYVKMYLPGDANDVKESNTSLQISNGETKIYDDYHNVIEKYTILKGRLHGVRYYYDVNNKDMVDYEVYYENTLIIPRTTVNIKLACIVDASFVMTAIHESPKYKQHFQV